MRRAKRPIRFPILLTWLLVLPCCTDPAPASSADTGAATDLATDDHAAPARDAPADLEVDPSPDSGPAPDASTDAMDGGHGDAGEELEDVRPVSESDFHRELCIEPEASPRVVRGPGGTVKVCQLTGEEDRERGEQTVNRTLSRAGIYGTDLGASFEHDGRLWFLFGDTVGVTMGGDDSMAWSVDQDPDDCIEISFLVDDEGAWLPPVVPGVRLTGFEVPMEGVSVDGSMYVYFTTDHSNEHTMGRSVLARSEDDGRSFEHVADVSTLGSFINVSVVMVNGAELPGLPSDSGRGLLIWGSGEYRQSGVHLAWQPVDEIEDPASMRYFSRVSDDCSPLWSPGEQDAAPLIEERCVGELSVEWNPHLRKWLMTYNCGEPRGIRFHTADHPWGPWSESQSLFHPWDDGGYCHFIHVSHQLSRCDEIHDPGRADEFGGEYGPYQIPRFSREVEGGGALVYFVMSTWNPYNVVLMRSQLLLE